MKELLFPNHMLLMVKFFLVRLQILHLVLNFYILITNILPMVNLSLSIRMVSNFII